MFLGSFLGPTYLVTPLSAILAVQKGIRAWQFRYDPLSHILDCGLVRNRTIRGIPREIPLPLVDGQSESAKGRKKNGPQNALKRSKMGSKARRRLEIFGDFEHSGDPPPYRWPIRYKGEVSRGIALIRFITHLNLDITHARYNPSESR